MSFAILADLTVYFLGSLFPLQSIMMLILWCIGLPIIMNPSNGIAVGMAQVVNANLYLSSWICFGCIVFLVGDLMGDFFAGHYGTALGLSRLDPETGEYVTTAPFSAVQYQRLWETRRGKWFALAVITGIALSSSVRTFQAFQCTNEAITANSNTCVDSKVAISMTTIGCIVSVIMVGIGSIGGSMVENIEKFGAVFTTGIWTVCLGFITFGEGPVGVSIPKNHICFHRRPLLILILRFASFPFVNLPKIGSCPWKFVLCDLGWIHYQYIDHIRLFS